jgi:signal peptidase I
MALETTVVFMGWALGSFVLSLMVWVLIPTLAMGWRPMVVTSDSMTPSIRTGDIVLVDPDATVRVGEVIAFDSAGTTVVHRVANIEDEVITTHGDANERDDSTPVSPSDIGGVGRMLVPYVGLTRTIASPWVMLVVFSAAGCVLTWRRRPMTAAILALAGIGLGTVAAACGGGGVMGRGPVGGPPPTFSTLDSNDANSLATVDLAPPTELTATCNPVSGANAVIDLTWTGSTSPAPTGYAVYYDDPSAGTNYVEVGTTSSVVTSFSHQINLSGLSVGTHTYMVRTESGTWQSEDSTTDAVSIAGTIVYVCTDL